MKVHPNIVPNMMVIILHYIMIFIDIEDGFFNTSIGYTVC
ncbi:hypothetical protein SAMN05216564_1197 [Halopenitus persicus]|uniref:Uncharacterized protein n=1 Tax=Halopenitus persicus TaxID=1048396 RepID=A0A1H3P3W1_9EURY|nr:hypothetical protein SAMN05216564_1197 [Halopenitus persicus]